jgi:predicted DsbA family dithiol-disulfide isomerase
MLTIDVVSDVVCPWCFIGLTRLDRVLAALDAPVEVVLHPFLLQPDPDASPRA